MEKDKIIETLRKENLILQNSLKQCMDQCISIPNNDDDMKSVNVNQQQMSISINEQIQQIWYDKRNRYEKQIIELNEKIDELNNDLYRQQRNNESLRIRYENLEQLNENDQLKIVHLEEKISRLTEILFRDLDNNKIIDDDDGRQNKLNHHHDTTFMNGSTKTRYDYDDDDDVDGVDIIHDSKL